MRAGFAGDERPGGVAQRVEAQRAKVGRVAGGAVAAAECGGVEAPPESRAEHVVVPAGVVIASGEPCERRRDRVRERQGRRLPALGRPLDVGAG